MEADLSDPKDLFKRFDIDCDGNYINKSKLMDKILKDFLKKEKSKIE